MTPQIISLVTYGLGIAGAIVAAAFGLIPHDTAGVLVAGLIGGAALPDVHNFGASPLATPTSTTLGPKG